MKNDWRSWKTQGSWLTDGQKQDLDDFGALVIVLFLFAIYIWSRY